METLFHINFDNQRDLGGAKHPPPAGGTLFTKEGRTGVLVSESFLVPLTPAQHKQKTSCLGDVTFLSSPRH